MHHEHRLPYGDQRLWQHVMEVLPPLLSKLSIQVSGKVFTSLRRKVRSQAKYRTKIAKSGGNQTEEKIGDEEQGDGDDQNRDGIDF